MSREDERLWTSCHPSAETSPRDISPARTRANQGHLAFPCPGWFPCPTSLFACWSCIAAYVAPYRLRSFSYVARGPDEQRSALVCIPFLSAESSDNLPFACQGCKLGGEAVTAQSVFSKWP